MNSGSPYTQPTLIQDLAEAEADVAAFFGSLSLDELVHRIGAAWTPAEHLEHINIAVSAVARGLSLPRLLLRVFFGRGRPSRRFEELRDHYLARLEEGAGAAGRFVPAREDLAGEERSIRRAELLARWRRVNQRLRAALNGWSERDLDRIRLPHPILGKITAREMVFFTIYHDRHHIASAQRRLPRFMPTSSA